MDPSAIRIKLTISSRLWGERVYGPIGGSNLSKRQLGEGTLPKSRIHPEYCYLFFLPLPFRALILFPSTLWEFFLYERLCISPIQKIISLNNAFQRNKIGFFLNVFFFRIILFNYHLQIEYKLFSKRIYGKK